MPISSRELQTPSHSNEIEHRLTKVEVQTDSHKGKIGYLERAVQGLIYVVAAIASSKSGDLVEAMLSILNTLSTVGKNT